MKKLCEHDVVLLASSVDDRQFGLKHVLYQTVTVLNCEAKLLNYWSVYFLTYAHSFWVATKRTRSRLKRVSSQRVAELSFGSWVMSSK